MTEVLGLVPVLLDDLDAPYGCTALRTLGSASLLALAVQALLESGVAGDVLVVTPAAALHAVEEALALLPPAQAGVHLIASPEPLSRLLLPSLHHGLLAGPRAGLKPTGASAEVVVVHDPRCGQAPAELVRLVVGALQDDPGSDAAVPVRDLTDTVKWVSARGQVLGTPDRAAFRVVSTPQAYRRATLSRVLAAVPEAALNPERAGGSATSTGSADLLPGLVRAAGGRVRAVASDREIAWLADETGLLLAQPGQPGH